MKVKVLKVIWYKVIWYKVKCLKVKCFKVTLLIIGTLISFLCCTFNSALSAREKSVLSSQAVYKTSGCQEKKIVHNGLTRTYIVHIPPQYDSQNDSQNDSQKKVPLLLFFHGGGGNAGHALASYGILEKADKEGFILAAPQGTGFFKRIRTWNVKFGFGYAKRNNIDDIGFVRKLISELKGDYKIDSNRIFAAGMSNGGFLCHFLAAALSDEIAAIAPVAASIGGRESFLEGNESSEEDYIFPTLPEKPVSVIAFNGLADKHVPYYGGLQEKYAGARPVYITSAQQMHAFWIKANQCLPKAQIFRDPLNQYKKITYRGKENTEIVQYIIFDHGHSWPGGRVLRLGRGDVPCKAVNATDVMWEFFKSHPKR